MQTIDQSPIERIRLCMPQRPAGWLAGWLLIRWLVRWLAAGWLHGWLLAGWLADCLAHEIREPTMKFMPQLTNNNKRTINGAIETIN